MCPAGEHVRPGEARNERVSRSDDQLRRRPTCRIRPSAIAATRSASTAASWKSCVTSSTGSASSSRISLSSSRSAARVCGSRADSGSSSSSTPGSRASARARPTRCRSPPESSPGRARARCEIRKRSSSSAADRARRTPRSARPSCAKQRVVLEDEPDAAWPPARPLYTCSAESNQDFPVEHYLAGFSGRARPGDGAASPSTFPHPKGPPARTVFATQRERWARPAWKERRG